MPTFVSLLTGLINDITAKFNATTPRLLPGGGTTGQALTKKTNADNDAQWTTLGTAASAATGTSGHTVPFLDCTNTWANAQTFQAAITAANLSGTNTGDQTDIPGNAATATKLATGHTIATTGDVAWTSPAFDGTANVTAAATLATTGVTAGSYGAQVGLTVPSLAIDAKGRVTSASSYALGTAATANTGTSGHAVPFLDNANTFSASQTMPYVVTDQISVKTINSAGLTLYAAYNDASPIVNIGTAYDGSKIVFNVGNKVVSPSTASSWDLGSATAPWKNFYATSATINGLTTINMSGNNYARFNNGAANATPGLSIGGSGGKSLNLCAGTQGTAFVFDQTGSFAIVGDTKANIDGGNAGNGTVLLNVTGAGNASLTGALTAAGATIGSGGVSTSGGLSVASSGSFCGGALAINGNTSAGAYLDGTYGVNLRDARSGATTPVATFRQEGVSIATNTTVTGSLTASNFSGSSTGTNTGDQTTITGNAGSATKLATARTIASTGDVAWSTSFDGTGNATGTATLAASGVTAGTYGASNLTVPTFAVDAKGRITSAGSFTLGNAAAQSIGTSGATVPLLNQANTWAAAQTFGSNISASNFSGSSSGTNTGDQTNISGNAATATLATAASSLTNLVVTNSAAVAPDTVAQNVVGYANPVSALGRTDGALYAQAYSPLYQHQLFGDYRTGQIAVRGKANDTTGSAWTAWRAVLDSGNYNSYAPSLTGTGANGTWNINTTGNAGSASSLNGPATVSTLQVANNATFNSGVQVNGVASFNYTPMQVGAGVATGYYGDSTNLAIRLQNNSNSTLFIQTYNGAANVAYFNAAGSNFVQPIYASSASFSGTTNFNAPVNINNQTLTVSGSASFSGGATVNNGLTANGGLVSNTYLTSNGTFYVNGTTQVLGNGTQVQFYTSGAGTDTKMWRNYVVYNTSTTTSSSMYWDIVNDASSASQNWMRVDRNGNTITGINFNGPIYANGALSAANILANNAGVNTQMVLQSDKNFVFYYNGAAIWSSLGNNFQVNPMLTAGGGLTVNGSATVNSSNITFNGGSGGANVGYACYTGVFLDGNNVGFRTYGNNGIYFQNGGGGTTYAWFDNGGANFNRPIYANNGITVQNALNLSTGVWHTTTDGVQRFYVNAGGASFYNSQNDRHVFRTSQNDRFYINTDGSATLVGRNLYFNNSSFAIYGDGSNFTFSGGGSFLGALCSNRNPIYLGGFGDLNHSIGNGFDSYNGSNDGESINLWNHLVIRAKQSNNVAMFVEGRANNNSGFGNNGYVGILGITDPKAPLEVNGVVQAFNYQGNGGADFGGQFRAVCGNRVVMWRNDGNNFYLLFSDDAGSNQNARTATFNGSRPMRLGFDGSMHFNEDGGNDSYFGRNVTINGTASFGSDIRLKTDVETVTGALDKVRRMRGVTYTLKSDGSRSAGVIADEHMEVAPELVSVRDDDIKTVNYNGNDAYLIEAIKELAARVEALEAR